MRYQATITLDFEAEDVYAERSQKARLMDLLDKLAVGYVEPTLRVRARRQRVKPRAPAPEKLGRDVQIVRALYVG